MKTATGYIRVSTDDQANEGISLEAQRARLAAWCVVNDYELLDCHVDAGISGGRADNRPGLQSAIDHACKSKSALVVYSLSRLARSTKDTIAIGERLEKAGADLVSLSEKIDTTSAAGKMIFRLFAVMAEFEKDQISERTKMAMAHKKSKGERVGAIPYGFDLADNGVTLVANPGEQTTVGLILDLRNAGQSLRAIAAELDRRGIPSKVGRKWNHVTVRSIVMQSNELTKCA